MIKREQNFYSGTTTWRECFLILQSLLQRFAITDGPFIKKFEEKFAENIGVRRAFSFASGRMALYSLLEAMGIGEGSEVIIPAFTCVVVPNAIIYRGAKPVYVDIKKDSFNIDVAKIREKITKKTKAIIVQHTFGYPADVDKIAQIAKKYKLYVIEDCAPALGAEYKGKKIGSLTDASFFSFDHTKVISTGLGGMAVVNNPNFITPLTDIYNKTPFLRKQQILRIFLQMIAINFLTHPNIYFLGKYIMEVFRKLNLFFFFYDEELTAKPKNYPYPARLSNIQALIGLSQLENLAKNISHRQKIAQQYNQLLGLDLGNFSDRTHIFLRYSFLVKDPGQWIDTFKDCVELRRWFDSIAYGRREDFYKIYYKDGDCPVAEKITKHCVNLPTHLRIKDISDFKKALLTLKETIIRR